MVRKIDLTTMEKITVVEAFKKYARINNIFDHELFFKEAEQIAIEQTAGIMLI